MSKNKLAFGAAALALAGALTAAAPASAKEWYDLKPEDVSSYNLVACTADGQTAHALFGVEGSPKNYKKTGDAIAAMFKNVVGHYTASEFMNYAPALVDEMTNGIEETKQKLGNMDMTIAGASDHVTPGCALK